MTSSGAVPVETILRLTLDRVGAQGVQDFLDRQESSFSRVEQIAGRISSSMESAGRTLFGLAGVAGVGSVINSFMNTSQSGSNLALAAGHVTGGAGAWHPYGQALLSAQASTGVNASAIGQGLIMAIQQVGGNPSPAQAAVLGGLIAGIGQTDGMTPAQVAQVVSPLLAAGNKQLTATNLTQTVASIQGGLTAFPGSQAAPMMQLLSQLGVSQALGSGPAGGFTANLGGLTAAVNAAAQTNSIWRSPSLTGGAINSVSGALQGAYQNPSQQAFFQMAGIGYGQQRAGFTPQNMQKIMSEATTLYGTGDTRDIMLRSMFGFNGADLLEQFAPGSAGAKNLAHDLAHPGSTAHLKNLIGNAQQRTTPNATASKWEGNLMHWLQASPLHAALGVGGILAAPSLLKGGLSKLTGGIGGIADSAGLGIGEVAAGLGTAGLAAVAQALIEPSTAGETGPGSPSKAVAAALKAAQGRHFGSLGGEEKYLWNQFGYRQDSAGNHIKGTPQSTMPWITATNSGATPHGATQAQQLLEKLFQYVNSLGGTNPLETFSQAAQNLLQAANKLKGPNFSSYTPGSAGTTYASYLGAGGVQSLSSMGASVEFAALSGGSGGSNSLLASYGLSGNSGGHGGSSPQLVSLKSLLSGGGSSKQVVAAAAAKYHIPFDVLWGVFGMETTFGHNVSTSSAGAMGDFQFTAASKPGAPGLYPMTNTPNAAQRATQALDAAGYIAYLLKHDGSLDAALQAYSGGGYGLSDVLAKAGGAKAPTTAAAHHAAASHHAATTPRNVANAIAHQGPGFSQAPVHVHVYVDGHKVQAHRVLLGHSPH